MITAASTGRNEQRDLRLWPGVVAIALLLLIRFALPFFWPETFLVALVASLVIALAILIWWIFFSRAPKLDRWAALPVMIAIAALTFPLIDKSIAGAMMGLMFAMYSIPVLSLLLVLWAVATRNGSLAFRRASFVGALLLFAAGWNTLRTDGITGSADSLLAWRWSKTAEQRLLAQEELVPAAPAALPPASTTVPMKEVSLPVAPVEITPKPPTANSSTANWPGFRGPHRDGIVHDVRVNKDWAAARPVEIWHRAVGPGWSSFAVHGDLIFTQEQRGENEVVSCYRLSTGKPVWAHRDAARFWESNGGAGPRATPTLSNGRVYSLGATGILNVLDEQTGALIWSHNAAADTESKTPGWGFSASPLVIDDVVIAATSGRVVAYDSKTGERRWMGPAGSGTTYSSPQLFTIDGVPQVVLMAGHGPVSFAPADGTVLWHYEWTPGAPIVQPAMTADGDLLLSEGDNAPLRRISVRHAAGGWNVEERWRSSGLKPNFNDYVIHNGHAFGFDGSILACIDLKDGKRSWKGGRYGQGQLILLADQNLLLIEAEQGDLALVFATPDQYKEVARISAIEGKSWNHPVLVGDVLLVRNDQQMAAFRLTMARP